MAPFPLLLFILKTEAAYLFYGTAYPSYVL